MLHGNKEIVLSVRDQKGTWTTIDIIVGGLSRPKEFRTEAAAQREGAVLVKEGKVDAFKIYKLASLHH